MHPILQLGLDFLKGKPPVLRSSKWETVRKHFIEEHPYCVACYRKDKLQCHHMVPFHLDKKDELNPNNLITLCENTETNCHLQIGHLGNWKTFNKNVIKDAEKFESKFKL